MTDQFLNEMFYALKINMISGAICCVPKTELSKDRFIMLKFECKLTETFNSWISD